LYHIVAIIKAIIEAKIAVISHFSIFLYLSSFLEERLTIVIIKETIAVMTAIANVDS
jgi:hypothetical protein